MIKRFVEVYCKCDLDTLEKRDRTDLYKRERQGEIANFAGVTGPYEPPDTPEVLIDTGRETIAEGKNRILNTLERMGYIPTSPDSGYTEEEERKTVDRLEDLGYL